MNTGIFSGFVSFSEYGINLGSMNKASLVDTSSAAPFLIFFFCRSRLEYQGFRPLTNSAKQPLMSSVVKTTYEYSRPSNSLYKKPTYVRVKSSNRFIYDH